MHIAFNPQHFLLSLRGGFVRLPATEEAGGSLSSLLLQRAPFRHHYCSSSLRLHLPLPPAGRAPLSRNPHTRLALQITGLGSHFCSLPTQSGWLRAQMQRGHLPNPTNHAAEREQKNNTLAVNERPDHYNFLRTSVHLAPGPITGT